MKEFNGAILTTLKNNVQSKLWQKYIVKLGANIEILRQNMFDLCEAIIATKKITNSVNLKNIIISCSRIFSLWIERATFSPFFFPDINLIEEKRDYSAEITRKFLLSKRLGQDRWDFIFETEAVFNILTLLWDGLISALENDYSSPQACLVVATVLFGQRCRLCNIFSRNISNSCDSQHKRFCLKCSKMLANFSSESANIKQIKKK